MATRDVNSRLILSRRATFGLMAGAAGLASGLRPALAAPQKVRIGLATKTWWPSIIAQTASDQGLFGKSGLDAELTVYRSGGEGFEALAAGATDLIIGAPAQMGTGRLRGVMSKIVALGVTAYTGWKLLVPTGSPIKSVEEIAGKKVGITAAGSLSDFLALWSRSQYKMDFTSVPLGGGGLAPNLLSKNVDAAIVYSPLSFQMLQAGQVRELVNYATAIPPHLNCGWATSDAIISGKKDMVRNTLKALYGATAYLQKNRDAAIKILCDVNDIPPAVAQQEFEETYLKLSTDGTFTPAETELGMELARTGGFKDLAPAADIVTTEFVPVALNS
jgi:NitT/TauT family transport system substrate-binding protein